ncbi:MAG TPA: hemerythrin domain-containing protein [Moheibacter sp.]|nr:hemerythrin domain-containing protein [Moheibacter sp.]
MESAEWPLDVLANYIEQTHHQYCERQINIISPLLEALVLDESYEKSIGMEIAELFKKTAGEMSVHMKKEELMLFPFIKKMVRMDQESIAWTPPRFGTVENPIEMMLEDHQEELARFERIRTLTDNYQISGEAAVVELLNLLKAFQLDLIEHIHLENDILFPKALLLEKKLTKN